MEEELTKNLSQTKEKYSKVLCKYDPKFKARLEKEQKEQKEAEKKSEKTVGKGCGGCLVLVGGLFTFGILSILSGATSDGDGDLGAVFGLCLIAVPCLVFGIKMILWASENKNDEQD